MREVWLSFIASKNKAIVQNSQKPYIFDRYNVLPQYAMVSNLTQSTLARVFNQVVEGLNENDWVPCYMILLPDWDLIEDSKHFGFGCKVVFQDMISWLCKNIEAVLEVRKDDLRKKNKGAILDVNGSYVI